MIRSYLKITLRNFRKQKAHSLVNVLGLAFGIACFAVLTLFVRHEFGYDQFHEKSDRIARVLWMDTAKAESKLGGGLPGGFAKVFKDDIPELEDVFRIGVASGKVVTAQNKRFLGSPIYLTDSGFLNSIDFPVYEGSFKNYGLSPTDIFISKKEAERIYGPDQSYVGRSLEVSELGEFIVRGVYELPQNTIFQFKYIVSFAKVTETYAELLKFFPDQDKKRMLDWNVFAFSVYGVFNAKFDHKEALEAKFTTSIKKHEENGIVALESLEDVHFSPHGTGGLKAGDISYVRLYMAIGVIILLIACINYMNMSTARYVKRSKEVGVRKSVGSTRRALVVQFFVESISMTFVAMIMAICLIELFLPSFNAFMNVDLAVNYLSIEVLFQIALSIIVIGFVAGIYPALVLSKFNVVDVLKGKTTRGKSGLLFRQILVGFQFVACIGLFTATLIVSLQFNYLSKFDTGFDTDLLVTVPLKDAKLKKSYESFKAEVLRNPDLVSVTGTTFHFAGSGGVNFRWTPEGVSEEISIALVNVEKDFVQELGLEIIEGEDFNTNEAPLDGRGVLINETAVKAFGWNVSVGKKMQQSSKDEEALKVHGVVKDFAVTSPRNELKPVMIVRSKSNFEYAVIKLSKGRFKEGLDHVETVFNQFSNEYPFEYSFVDDDLVAQAERESRLATIFRTFSVLAVFIAALGLFGLSIYMSEQKIKEIGIRKVLGAPISSILWLFNHEVGKLVLISSAIILPVSYWFMDRWLQDFPYSIEMKVWYFLVPFASMLAISLLTMSYQSIKSATSNPVKALRTE